MSIDHTVPEFAKGTQNMVNPEIIDMDAAQDSVGWLTKEGKIVLAYGRNLQGNDTATPGKVCGLGFGYRADGVTIMYRKVGTVIQYLDSGTWTTIITGLTLNADYTFSNYTSLAGNFTYATGVDGIWKIINAFPTDPMNMNDAAKNFGGNTFIDLGRMWLWNKPNSLTTLFASKLDQQLVGVNYTAVTGETSAASGTLAFKAGGATRHCFNVSITVTGSGEVFTDNWCGVLKGSLGNAGTINYVTGAYVLTTGGGVGTAAYTWEDSNIGGVTDFTYSVPRVKGDGMFFSQDFGGDPILNVYVGQDGAYYSLKHQSSYVVTLDTTDLAPKNNIFRKDLGILSGRAAVATNKGIAFINMANALKPEFTILQKSIVTNNVEPVILFPKYRFANYLYDDAVIDTWERYVVVFCKTPYAAYNDTILMCDLAAVTVDAVSYEGRCTAKDQGNLYVGSSITETVYQLFNGFDDMGYPVTNYWVSKRDQYMMATGFVRRLRYQVGEALKKFRRLKVKGVISNSQIVQVYLDYDNAGFQLVGTILGSGTYVDYSSPQSIGSNMIGQSQIGGDDALAIAYPFFVDFKVNMSKFRARTIKFIATGIGYVHIEYTSDFDIMIFEERLPVRYRSKMNVSLDGKTNDIPQQ